MPPMGPVLTACSWMSVVAAGVGLVLLFRVTMADPGFLPRRTGSSSAARSSARPQKTLQQPLDALLGRYAGPSCPLIRFIAMAIKFPYLASRAIVQTIASSNETEAQICSGRGNPFDYFLVPGLLYSIHLISNIHP